MIELLPARVTSQAGPRGLVLSSPVPLPEPARCVGDWLVAGASRHPDRILLAERGPDGDWRPTTYGQALAAVEGLASALLELGARPDRPVLMLSENSVSGALVALAAMHIGVPAAPVSAAWSLISTTFSQLRDVAAQLRPGFVFADEPARYAAALAALGDLDAPLLCEGEGPGHRLADLWRRPASPAQREAFAALGPDSVAKVLFTSGSTGSPKGVVNTQRMLTSNQESIAACWPFLAARPPRVVDWLPWSHTFGSNQNFFMVLRNGGSLFIDRGRPAPGLIRTTLENMAEVAPNLWFNVPRGFDQAVALLEREPELSAAVFRELDLIFYAAAALSPSTRARLERLAAAAGRPDVFFTSAWGSTETAPLCTSAHFPTPTTGVIGLPAPGVALKLAPVQDKLELRVRGPNITPGYWQPGGGLSPVALDDEGYLPTGDAGELAEPGRPESGVVIVGRLSENFKLSTGTWVTVGRVRAALVDAAAGLLLDAVITGADREALGALLFLSPAAAGLAPDEIRLRLWETLKAHNAAHPGSSTAIARARISERPLSLDAGETTDKGYTNQRRVLTLRAAEVEALYAEPAPDDVIALTRG